jgi:hypothetical protein
MRVNPTRAGATLAAALLAFAVAVPASAQQPAPPAEPAPDEAELTTFTEAFLDIEEISTDVETKVAAAQTDDEKTKIREEAEAKAASVLETREIARERYEQITALLEANPELRAQFEALRDKLREERKKAVG